MNIFELLSSIFVILFPIILIFMVLLCSVIYICIDMYKDTPKNKMTNTADIKANDIGQFYPDIFSDTTVDTKYPNNKDEWIDDLIYYNNLSI